MQQQQLSVLRINSNKTNINSTNTFKIHSFALCILLNSLKPKKRYPDRFKAFIDYIQIFGTDIEEKLVNFYNPANQNLPWLQSSLTSFFIFQKERFKILYGNELMVIASIEDLAEVLYLTQTGVIPFLQFGHVP